MMFSLFLAAALQVATPAPAQAEGPPEGPVDTEQQSDSIDDSRAAPTPADEADAAVSDPKVANQEMLIRKSLATWQGGAAKHDGKVGCVTKQTTGDKQIDAIRCGAIVTCFTPVAPKLDALEANDALTDEERQRQMAAVSETTAPCLKAYTDKAIGILAKTRAGE